jgi:hypothetical protein
VGCHVHTIHVGRADKRPTYTFRYVSLTVKHLTHPPKYVPLTVYYVRYLNEYIAHVKEYVHPRILLRSERIRIRVGRIQIGGATY